MFCFNVFLTFLSLYTIHITAGDKVSIRHDDAQVIYQCKSGPNAQFCDMTVCFKLFTMRVELRSAFGSNLFVF